MAPKTRVVHVSFHAEVGHGCSDQVRLEGVGSWALRRRGRASRMNDGAAMSSRTTRNVARARSPSCASVASRRAALDAEELALIRGAVRIQIWRPLGMVSMREYLERGMGYGPQVAARTAARRRCARGAARDRGRARLGRAELQRGSRADADRDAQDRGGVARRRVAARSCARSRSWSRSASPAMGLTAAEAGPAAKRVSMAAAARGVRADAAGARGARSIRGERNDYNDLLGEAFRCLLAMHAGGALVPWRCGDGSAEGEWRCRGDAAEGGAGDGGAAEARARTHDAMVIIERPTRRARRSRRSRSARAAARAGSSRRAGRSRSRQQSCETAECDAVHIGSLDGAPAARDARRSRPQPGGR